MDKVEKLVKEYKKLGYLPVRTCIDWEEVSLDDLRKPGEIVEKSSCDDFEQVKICNRIKVKNGIIDHYYMNIITMVKKVVYDFKEPAIMAVKMGDQVIIHYKSGEVKMFDFKEMPVYERDFWYSCNNQSDDRISGKFTKW